MLPHMIRRINWLWYPRTLRAQLVRLVFTTLVPCVVFSAGVIFLYAQQDRQTAERGMRETARALAVDHEVAKLTTALEILANSPTLATESIDFEDFYHRCLDALRFLPPEAGIGLSDVWGQQLLNTRRPFGTPLLMIEDMEGLKRIVDTGQPSTSDLFIGPVTQRPMIAIGVPVFRAGQVRYVLHLTLLAETLGRILVEQRLPAGWLGGINDRKQIILATTPGLERFIGEPVTPRMAERSAVAEEGWFPNIAKDGTSVYSVFSRARSTGWTIVLNPPASLIDAPLHRSLVIVLSGGLALGALAVGTAVGLSRRIAAPIRALINTAQALGRGEPLARAPVSSVREVHAVGCALVEAGALLQQREAALQEALRSKVESLALLDALFAGAPIGMAFFDRALRFVRLNEALATLNGIPVTGHLGRTLHELFGEATAPIEARLSQVLETGDPLLNYEGQEPTLAPVGEQHYVANFYPIRTSDGHLLGVGATVADITARKRMEDQLRAALQVKEVLLKEVHHRVKNNLQIIASLLSLQAGAIRDPEAIEVFKESQGRVRSMALVHETLYQSEDLARFDFAQYVTTLAAQLVRSYAAVERGIVFKLQTEWVLLNIDTAIPCGLILNELLTNALKYAFPAGQPGEIQIALHAAPGSMTLSIQDTGIGFPEALDFRQTDSLGLQLVCMLTEQLNGTIVLERGEGARFTLTLPVETSQTAGNADGQGTDPHA